MAAMGLPSVAGKLFVDKEDPDAAATLAVEQIVASLNSMAATQKALCDIAQELLKEMKRRRKGPGGPSRRD